MAEVFDVFLSYAHQDKEAVQVIVDGLLRIGLTVWRDEREINTFQSITGSIMEGLARSKTLLAYYSKVYPQRRACQWELTSAFIAAEMEGDPRRRIMVVNPEPGAQHIHPIELRDAKFLRPDSLQLLSAIRNQATSVRGTFADIRQFLFPRWLGLTGIGSTRFVGRFPELWQIHSELHTRENAAIAGRVGPSVTAVSGLGGIGKSLLAEEYALQFGAAFSGGGVLASRFWK